MSEARDRSFGPVPRVVLVVVDNPTHRALFNRHLKSTHHHLVYAADGEDGFDRFTECKPDIVIAHINLPRLDGTILCQLIRQDPRGGQVAVVLLGETVDAETGPDRAMAVAADAYLSVPFTPDQLSQCLGPMFVDGRPPVPSKDISSEHPVVNSGELGRPTELTFGSMLADFMTQTDEAAGGETAPVPSPVEQQPSSRPVSRPGSGGDMDTVVSFQNPFYEGDGPSPVGIEALSAAPEEGPTRLPGVAIIEPPLGQDEPPTPVGAPPASPPEPVTRVSSDLGNEQPVTELAPSPSGKLEAAPLPPPLDAQPKDPLEEPKISGPGSGVRPMPQAPGKSQLIRELPRDPTPSDDQRASQVQKRSGGQRRGLDESQLGKRLSKRVRTMHRLLDEVDYYQLLGVERSADHDALRRAYFDLSLEFHPDRFFLLRSGGLKEKIYLIYRRIAEAYRVLGDERKRTAYDEARSLSSVKRAAPELRGDTGPEPTADSAPEHAELAVSTENPAAQRYMDLAREAYDQGDFVAARMHLVFARAQEPQNPSLQAALQLVASRHVPFSVG